MWHARLFTVCLTKIISYLLCLRLCLVFFLFSRTQRLPSPAASHKVPQLEYMWLLQKPESLQRPHLPFVSHRGKFEPVNTQPHAGLQFRFSPQMAAGCIWWDQQMLLFVCIFSLPMAALSSPTQFHILPDFSTSFSPDCRESCLLLQLGAA